MVIRLFAEPRSLIQAQMNSLFFTSKFFTSKNLALRVESAFFSSVFVALVNLRARSL